MDSKLKKYTDGQLKGFMRGSLVFGLLLLAVGCVSFQTSLVQGGIPFGMGLVLIRISMVYRGELKLRKEADEAGITRDNKTKKRPVKEAPKKSIRDIAEKKRM